MKLGLKINLFSLIIPALMAVIIVISGLSVMNRIIYNLNYKLIINEMNIIISLIESDHEVLKKAGVDDYPHYINQAKSDFLAGEADRRYHIESDLIILDTLSNSIVNITDSELSNSPELKRELFTNIKGDLQISYLNNKYFINYVKIPEWNWIVLIATSSEKLFKEISSYLIFVIPMSSILLITGLFLSYFFLKNVFIRINDSLTCLREVESGNLNITINVTNVEDEIQQLQLAINQMIGSLRNSYEELENRVELRTEELAQSNSRLLNEIEAGETARSEVSYLNSYLKNIIDSMPSILIGINRDLTINKWNPEAEKVSQLNEKNVVNSDIFSVIDKQNIAIYKLIDKIGNGNAFTEHQIKMTLGNSPAFFADISYFPLKEKRNEMGILQIRDITERFRLEELMKQSEKMLSVGGLAAGMAHEINNPLAGMMQSAQNINRRLKIDLPVNIETAEECGTSMELIEKYTIKRNIPEILQSIVNSGQKAAEIVESMISFSTNEVSAKKFSDMNSLLSNSLHLINEDIEYKHFFDDNIITVVEMYDEKLPEVPCDKSKLLNAFSNIIKNAVQSMIDYKTISPVLEIKTMLSENEIRIEIKDNGPGINDDIKKRVFEPFFSTKEIDKGKGLGLSVSYFIIREHHKGNMWLETESGKGTTIFITLPIERRSLK